MDLIGVSHCGAGASGVVRWLISGCFVLQNGCSADGLLLTGLWLLPVAWNRLLSATSSLLPSTLPEDSGMFDAEKTTLRHLVERTEPCTLSAQRDKVM